MNQNIYPIQLLNDIHNYLPDILYNPGRFRNVHDLLEYIRHIADVNPYTRGLNAYNNAYREHYVNSRPVQHRPPQVRATTTPSAQTSISIDELMEMLRNPNSTVTREFTTTTGDDIPVTVRTALFENDNLNTNVTSLPLRVIPNMTTNTGNIVDHLLNVFGIGSTFPDILQPFLEQRVPIVATPNQIRDATTIERVTSLQTEICTICQDQIDSGNEMRKIRHCGHYFHKTCIDTWFQSNVICPTCRHDIREIENNRSNINTPPPVPENHRRINIRESNNP
jgi:DNA topoisomerase VI subunit B